MLNRTPNNQEEKQSKTYPVTLNNLNQASINLILQCINIEEWIPLKSISTQWYQYVYQAFDKLQLPKQLHLFFNIPYELKPDNKLHFLPDNLAANTVIPPIKLPENLLLEDKKNTKDIQLFANQYLIEELGWNNKDFLPSLLNILVYLKAKNTFDHEQNFLKQVIELFKDTSRLTTACLQDPTLAYLVYCSPLRASLLLDKKENKFEKTAKKARDYFAFAEASNYECVMNMGSKVASVLTFIHVTEKLSPDYLSKLVDHSIKNTVIHPFLFLAGAAAFMYSLNYAGIFMRTTPQNVEGMVSELSSEKPNLTHANFLKGNMHPFLIEMLLKNS